MNASAQRVTTISQPQGKKNIILYILYIEGKRKREFVCHLNIPEYQETREKESKYRDIVK